MKILHITTGLNHGGAEGALTRLALTDQDNQHEIASMLGDGAFGQMLREAGVPVHCLDFRSPMKAIKSFVRLIRLIRHMKPDVVQCWMYHANLFGSLAAWLAGSRKIAWNLRTIPNEWLSARSRAIILAGAKLSRRLPAAIICAGEEVGIAHRDRGYFAEKLVTIGNGIDTDRFNSDPAKGVALRQELGIAVDEWLVGRIARDVAQKDHATLFTALSELDQHGQAVRCLLIGHGMEEGNASFRDLAREAGVEHLLIYGGHRTDVEAVANAIDLLVSTSRIEGFPNAIAEAMACGTPVAATEAGASAQIVGSTGWIVPVGDGRNLAEMIGQARDLANHEQRRWSEIKAACIEQIAVNFSMQSMLRSYHDVWRRILRLEQAELATSRLDAVA